MARISSALTIFFLASANAFVVPSAQTARQFGFGVARHMSEAVAEAPVETAEETEVAAEPEPEPVALSGLSIPEVRKAISSLTKDNFEESLSKVEGFLTNEAGATFYAKSMKRIGVKAKAAGVEVPAGYALEAVATTKARASKAAHEEAKAAAAAEAAEAAAAAEAEAEPEAEEAPAAEE